MTHRPTRLILSPIFQEGRRRALWRLEFPYWRWLLFYGLHVPYFVPAGFVCDLASIPWFLRWLYPVDGPWAGAAVVHDHMYTQHDIGRGIADFIFWQLMRQDGVPVIRAAVFYAAVRTFGGPARKRALKKSSANF